MKLTAKTSFGTLTAAIMVCGSLNLAQAGPVGPSARSAARLKKNPTSKWLAHYLPDDRYKIAGGVWKYVSTDLDTYYHRPDSPLMMRQSAGRVIGFSSAAEAEEAGYKPAPGTGGFSFGEGDVSSSLEGGRRLTLSDGMTSVTLPRGWSRGASSVQNIQGGSITSDQLRGPSGEMMTISTVTAPANSPVDFSVIASMDFFKSISRGMSQFAQSMRVIDGTTGKITNNNNLSKQFETMRKSQKFYKVTLNGVPGIGITNSGTLMPGQPRKAYTIARSRKLWSIYDFSARSKGSSSIIASLQPR
jgi:hypothetical protein